MNQARGDWWSLGPRRWDEMIDPAMLDLHVEESRGLIQYLEQTTGKRFCETRFKAVLDLVNETEEYFVKARDLIARTRPAPISISDTFTSVMMPQWHRGTVWARDAARQFYEEVRSRVDQGEAACPGERVRLAWLGAGLWFNVGFYEAFMERYGAVFVWSMYLGYAADAYIRYGDEDRLRTLSARYAAFTQYLSIEPWASGWYVKEAQLNQIDGVVMLGGAWPFLDAALAKAGIPLLRLSGHNVDSRQWNEAALSEALDAFIRDQVLPAAEAKAQP
jgi:benzoyl-CoA reductase/2-hydroxyglutaryl-CoA dehydratase subunit BcrC/BadD/HgdB